MSKKFNKNMFESLKESLKKEPSSSSGSFDNIMKFPAGHTYRIRLIPNVDNIDDTFFHHWLNQWTSNSTGKFISAISLKTFGESDPISNQRWKMYKEWADANPNPGVGPDGKKKTFKNPITEKEQWLVNALWVDNPANPELNGTVQIHRFGPQIKKIIDDAIEGNGAEEFGASIFDLGEDGCDLLIVAEKKGEYTTYEASRFTTRSKLRLSDEEIEKIYENIHDLKSVYTVKTVDELNSLLDEHFFVKGEVKKEVTKPATRSTPTTSQKPSQKVEDDEDAPWEDDEIPMSHAGDAKRSSFSSEEDEVDELLKGLDD